MTRYRFMEVSTATGICVAGLVLALVEPAASFLHWCNVRRRTSR